MRRLRVGIIGLGSISRSGHLPAYKEVEEIQVVAAAEIRKDLLNQVCKVYGIPRPYIDYENMLEREKLDIVSVLTPPFLHKAMCVRIAEAGANVLCEKPLATSVEDGKDMLDVCDRNGVKLMYSENYRFMPASQKAKEYVDCDKLGRIILMTEKRHGGSIAGLIRRRKEGKLGWRQTRRMSGGGVLLDHGIHAVDLFRWLVGSEIESTYAKTRSFSGIEVEDFAQMFISFENDSQGYIENSWVCRCGGFADLEVIVCGEKATLFMNPRMNVMRVFAEGSWSPVELPDVEKNGYMQVYSTRKLMESFAQSCLKNKPPSIPGTEGLKDLEGVLEAYESEKGSEDRKAF